MALFTKQIRSFYLYKHIIQCSRQFGYCSKPNVKNINILKHVLFGCGTISSFCILKKLIAGNKDLVIIPDLHAKESADETVEVLYTIILIMLLYTVFN